VQLTARHPARDYELSGHSIPRGHEVNVLLGSGNRDPEVFPDPDRFDIGRSNVRHLSFGQGTHFCMGAQLARLESQVAIGALLARRPDIEIEAPPERRRGFVLRGLKSLRVRLGS
jgi:cytochrome P450